MCEVSIYVLYFLWIYASITWMVLIIWIKSNARCELCIYINIYTINTVVRKLTHFELSGKRKGALLYTWTVRVLLRYTGNTFNTASCWENSQAAVIARRLEFPLKWIYWMIQKKVRYTIKHNLISSTLFPIVKFYAIQSVERYENGSRGICMLSSPIQIAFNFH